MARESHLSSDDKSKELSAPVVTHVDEPKVAANIREIEDAITALELEIPRVVNGQAVEVDNSLDNHDSGKPPKILEPNKSKGMAEEALDAMRLQRGRLERALMNTAYGNPSPAQSAQIIELRKKAEIPLRRANSISRRSRLMQQAVRKGPEHLSNLAPEASPDSAAGSGRKVNPLDLVGKTRCSTEEGEEVCHLSADDRQTRRTDFGNKMSAVYDSWRAAVERYYDQAAQLAPSEGWFISMIYGVLGKGLSFIPLADTLVQVAKSTVIGEAADTLRSDRTSWLKRLDSTEQAQLDTIRSLGDQLDDYGLVLAARALSRFSTSYFSQQIAAALSTYSKRVGAIGKVDNGFSPTEVHLAVSIEVGGESRIAHVIAPIAQVRKDDRSIEEFRLEDLAFVHFFESGEEPEAIGRQRKIARQRGANVSLWQKLFGSIPAVTTADFTSDSRGTLLWHSYQSTLRKVQGAVPATAK